MSLLVMGIGVVAVATLFPASVMRSIQGTQLTNATVLRFNVEGLLDCYPELLAVVPNGGAQTTKAWVDPFGFRRYESEGETDFNFVDKDLDGDGVIDSNELGRYCPTTTAFSSEAKVARICSLEDSWLTLLETKLSAAAGTDRCTLPTSVSTAGIQVNAAGSRIPNSQVVLIGEQDGRTAAIARDITQLTGQTILWTEDLDGDGNLDPGEDFNGNGRLDTHDLPAGFVAMAARVQNWEPRYTWLLTVRKDSAGIANVDIVVYFRRSFNRTKDEQVFPGTYQGNGQYVVTLQPGDKPQWKKGGYLFDVQNARWHRVQKVDAGARRVTIEGAPSSLGTRVMFPRGVIEVYPIGNRLP